MWIHQQIKKDIYCINTFICDATKTVNEMELSRTAYQTIKEVKEMMPREIVQKKMKCLSCSMR